jgi:hypothetical protein
MFVSAALFSLGAIIAVLSGVCSLAVLENMSWGGLYRGNFNGLKTVSFFGGIPFAVGIALVGLAKLIKPRKEFEFNRDGYVTDYDRPVHMTEDEKQKELAKIKES